MSILPTKDPLATYGSEEAEMTALRPVDPARRTGSGLHVVHVGVAPVYLKGEPAACGYAACSPRR